MNELELQIAIDDIGILLRESGKSFDEIREWFTEEGERIADELEAMESE